MIIHTHTSGADIKKIVDEIEDVIEGYPSSQVSIACLVVACLAQRPDIAPDSLQQAVKGASEWLAAYLFQESPTLN